MELIRFDCPSCNHHLVVPPEAAAMSGPCPGCGVTIHGPNSPSAGNKPVQTTAPARAAVPAPSPQAKPLQEPIPRLESRTNAPEERYRPKPSETFPPASPSEPSSPVAAEPTPRRRLAPSKLRSGLPLQLAFIITLISSALFFVLGFLLGKSGSNSSAEEQLSRKGKAALQSNAQDAEPAPLEIPANLGVEASANGQGPAESTESSGAQATLNAFLSAQSWTNRNAYVLQPNRALKKMEASAEQFGDGAVAVDSLVLKVDYPSEKVFHLDTQSYPRPFPVSLVRESGMWKVDWDTFSEFYHDKFRRFAAGEQGEANQIFHLLIEPAPGESDPLSPARVLARAPHSETASQLTLGSESQVRRDLTRLLTVLSEDHPQTLKDAYATGGFPIIAKISRSAAENPSLRLEAIVAINWSKSRGKW